VSTPRTEPTLRIDDATLSLSGSCDATGVAGLGLSGHRMADIREIDIAAFEDLDSTGVALIGELVARITTASGQRPLVKGRPAGLEDFCRAYRIDPDFSNFP
jgi:phospholipid transport system transporter-binding protein